MTLERMQLSVAPGEGLVARYGPVVVVVTDVDEAASPVVERLLGICRTLGSTASGPPARWLVDRLAPLLGQPDSPSFCVLATGDRSLHCVIQGELDLWAARGDHLSRHTGAEPGTWVDVVIEGDFDSLTVGPAGTKPPVADPRVDLQGGVVVGNGILLFARPADQGAAAGDTVPVAVAARAPATGEMQATGATPTTTAPPGPAGGPGPGATSELPVVGPTCPQGHVNAAGAAFCSTCGSPLPSNGQGGAPPSLGALVLDDGTAFPLDTSYVIGREPSEAGTVQSGSSRAIAIDDPDRVVSRVHAEVRIAGRTIQLVDRDSVNGTYVFGGNGGGWERLAPNEPYELQPGGQVLIGRRTLRYEAAGS